MIIAHLKKCPQFYMLETCISLCSHASTMKVKVTNILYDLRANKHKIVTIFLMTFQAVDEFPSGESKPEQHLVLRAKK